MKAKMFILALVLILSAAPALFAAVYTDNHENYSSGWESGSNGGAGFMEWTIAANAGSGWSGGGIWSTTNVGITGWDTAFGIMAKGSGSSFTATRSFRKALEAGESFELDMAVAWDSNSEGSTKGFAVFAGEVDVITVNHGAFPGSVFCNGVDVGFAYGTTPMHWTFEVVDATTIDVTATSRDGIEPDFTTTLTVASSALSGFRLQSAEQAYEEEDARQTYFDNFTLTLNEELPPLLNLTLTEDAMQWYINAAGANTFNFTVTRDFSDVALDATVTSSDPAFAEPSVSTLSFPIGTTQQTFTVSAALVGNGNYAKITVSSPDTTSGTWEIKGPTYRLSVESNNYAMGVGNTINFWVNDDSTAIPKTAGLFEIVSTAPAAVSVGSYAWATNAEDESVYIASQVTGVSPGDATLQVRYADLVMADWNFSVTNPPVSGFTLSGPASIREGKTATFTLTAVDANGTAATATILDPAIATVDPADPFDIWEASEEIPLSVTAVSVGSTWLVVDNGTFIASNAVVVTAAPDYSDYIAYDDASRDGYDIGPLTLSPFHESGFADWQFVMNTSDDSRPEYIADTYTGAFVGQDPPASITDILEDGKTFGLYANGAAGAELQLLRPFAAPLGLGEQFSIDLGAIYRDGTKGFKLLGTWEDEWYPRAEFFYKSPSEEGANDGYFYKLDGDADATSLGWDYGEGVITLSLLRSADNSGYVLSIVRGEDTFTTNNVIFSGSVDGFQLYSYQGGSGDENNLFFNRMAITQEEEPVPPEPSIRLDGTYNPDAATDYTFTLYAENGFTGLVELASTNPAVATLAPASVTFDEGGATSAAITVSVLSLTNGSTLITATNSEAGLYAEYGIHPREASAGLWPTSEKEEPWKYDFVSGASVWFRFTHTPALETEWTVSSSNPDVATVSVETLTTEADTDSVFDVIMQGVGQTTIIVSNALGYAEYGITLEDNGHVVGPAIPVDAAIIISGEGGTLTFTTPDGYSPLYLRYATDIVDDEWDFADENVIEATNVDGTFTAELPAAVEGKSVILRPTFTIIGD